MKKPYLYVLLLLAVFPFLPSYLWSCGVNLPWLEFWRGLAGCLFAAFFLFLLWCALEAELKK